VMEGTLAPLAALVEVRHLVINQRSCDAPWPVIANPNLDDRFGIDTIPRLVDEFAPDAILIFNSFAALPRYARLVPRLGSHRPPLIAHCPVLNEPVADQLIEALSFFDVVVVLADVVKRHFERACTSRLEVIPHGFDSALFHPLPGERQGFTVLNANRYEPRKRIDLTMTGFARFAQGKPADVRLHLHMDPHPQLRELARTLNIEERVSFRDARLDDDALNRLYNACDVGINTANGEGWGMIAFEHAASGAPQIVPSSWVCGEVWRDHAELLAIESSNASNGMLTRETTVSIESVAQALERLYADREHRAEMSRRARAVAMKDEYQWSAIANCWAALIASVSAERAASPPLPLPATPRQSTPARSAASHPRP
jgi:glycosyltransferase involved in cell wall biosynthesis